MHLHVRNINLSTNSVSHPHNVSLTMSLYPSLQCVANAFSMFGCKHMLDIGFVDTSIQAIFPTTAGLNCWKMRGVVRIPTHPLYTYMYICMYILTYTMYIELMCRILGRVKHTCTLYIHKDEPLIVCSLWWVAISCVVILDWEFL